MHVRLTQMNRKRSSGAARNVGMAVDDTLSSGVQFQMSITLASVPVIGFNAGQHAKALSLYEKIMKEGLIPDSMTYTVLVRGCIQGGLLDKAVDLVRSAYGRSTTSSRGSAPGLNAGCFDELVAALGPHEAKEVVAELGNCAPASSGKGSGKGGGKSLGKGTAKIVAQAPWQQQRQQWT